MPHPLAYAPVHPRRADRRAWVMMLAIAIPSGFTCYVTGAVGLLGSPLLAIVGATVTARLARRHRLTLSLLAIAIQLLAFAATAAFDLYPLFSSRSVFRLLFEEVSVVVAITFPPAAIIAMHVVWLTEPKPV